MNYELRTMNYELKQSKVFRLSFFFFLFSFFSFSQVTTSIDSTSIQIGAQITYKIQIETDTVNSVIFPEGQSFLPLEMIESYKTDTTKFDAKYKLIKKYGLTQFDSGRYVIPKQKVIIAGKPFITDSLLVEVAEVAIDTTKQQLFDIKPMLEVDRPSSDWWKYFLLTLLLLAIAGFLVYWFVWRKKPLTEEEQIAMLPPYDRAKLALKKLDDSAYLEKSEYKSYYSELTLAIRKYLDEKVYSQALESTTDQLIDRLNILTDGNQIDLSKEDIKKLESVLKRADLVKFAKSAPDIELAKLDRTVIDQELDIVKEALPEPSEEDLRKNQEYLEYRSKKEKREKIWITAAVAVFMLGLTFGLFSYKYGVNYVIDSITGKDTVALLKGNWVNSDYGFPPISISTPEVLKRDNPPLPDDITEKVKISAFTYELDQQFSIVIRTVQLPTPAQGQEAPKAEDYILKAVEDNLKSLEAQGATNIISNKDKFTTPNGAEGLKTSGTLNMSVDKGFVANQFVLLSFANESVIQQIVINYLKDDVYLDQVVERILASVELNPKTE